MKIYSLRNNYCPEIEPEQFSSLEKAKTAAEEQAEESPVTWVKDSDGDWSGTEDINGEPDDTWFIEVTHID